MEKKQSLPNSQDFSQSKPKNLVVSVATLQSATMLPGGRTESTLTVAKIPGIEMLWVRNEGLLVKIKGDEALIPDTNVKIAHFKAPALN